MDTLENQGTVTDIKDNVIAYQGELMLTGWSDTSTRGRTVTFQVPEDEPEHPFKSFVLRQGKRSGTRFMAVLVQVNDDESIGHQEEHPSQQAARLCKNPRFWHWASEHTFDTVASEDSARYFILSLCKISSRSELDNNQQARKVFDYQIVQPFKTYISTVEAQL